MLKSKLVIAAVAVMFSSLAFAGGILGSTGSTDPFNSGFQGTKLWSDASKTGGNITVQATYHDFDDGDKTALGAGYDYKWANGAYAGVRIDGTKNTDSEVGYVGYTNTITDATTPFWVEVVGARSRQDYSYDTYTTRFIGVDVGAEKRWGDTRLGVTVARSEVDDSNVTITQGGVYAETPVYDKWVASVSASRYRAADSGPSLSANLYTAAIGKIFTSGIGVQVGVERAVVYHLADNVATAKLSFQF